MRQHGAMVEIGGDGDCVLVYEQNHDDSLKSSISVMSGKPQRRVQMEVR